MTHPALCEDSLAIERVGNWGQSLLAQEGAVRAQSVGAGAGAGVDLSGA